MQRSKHCMLSYWSTSIHDSQNCVELIKWFSMGFGSVCLQTHTILSTYLYYFISQFKSYRPLHTGLHAGSSALVMSNMNRLNCKIITHPFFFHNSALYNYSMELCVSLAVHLTLLCRCILTLWPNCDVITLLITVRKCHF